LSWSIIIHRQSFDYCILADER